MEDILIRVLQFLLSISLLVILHEGGHFFFSKLFGVKVDKFYLFFDPYFHLFSTKRTRWFTRLFPKMKDKETDYGIGWLPLGGYCKIAGMVDESMDTEQLASEPQPNEYRSRPAWQRFFIIIGGVLVNFLVAIIIYAMMLFTWGESYFNVSDIKQGFAYNQTAKDMGLQDGDLLLRTDKEEFGRLNVGDMLRKISDAETITALRDGQEITVEKPSDVNLLSLSKENPLFCTPLLPCRVDSVLPDTPAQKIGLVKGDCIVSLNGDTITSYNDFCNKVLVLSDKAIDANAADSLRLREATLVVQHANGAQDTLDVQFTTEFKLGYVNTTLLDIATPSTREYSFFESIPAGVRLGYKTLASYVSDLRYVFSKEGATSLGGFGTIAKIFPTTWDWEVFWSMTAFLSVILGFMNIIPIPALDGGYALMLIVEMITGRKLSDKWVGYLNYVGLSLLLILMLWANINDVIRAFFG
jgi:regulator of sigma E protease